MMRFCKNYTRHIPVQKKQRLTTVKLLKRNFHFCDRQQVEPQSWGLCSSSPQNRYLDLCSLPRTVMTGWLCPDFSTYLTVLLLPNQDTIWFVKWRTQQKKSSCSPYVMNACKKGCILALLNLFHDYLVDSSPKPPLQCNCFTLNIARDVIRILKDYPRRASQDITQKHKQS